VTNINDLIARWNTDDGKPYKGCLIDMDSYEDGNLSCMCAQGQVLHVLGGWLPEMLFKGGQQVADAETAKLLNISMAHSVLLRQINDMDDGQPAKVLTDPGAILGDQWSKLLDFWWYIDAIDAKEWRRVRDVWFKAKTSAMNAAERAFRDAIKSCDRDWLDRTYDVTRQITMIATWDISNGDCAASAAIDSSREIHGAEALKRDGKPFFFLSMFGFASPDDIPARPDDYGVNP